MITGNSALDSFIVILIYDRGSIADVTGTCKKIHALIGSKNTQMEYPIGIHSGNTQWENAAGIYSGNI